MVTDERAVNDLLPKMVSAIRFIRRDPEDPLAQLELICTCEHAVRVSGFVIGLSSHPIID